MTGTTYSRKLKCAFNAWRVIADGEIALELPAGNCCDMGGEADTEYRFSGGKWTAGAHAI